MIRIYTTIIFLFTISQIFSQRQLWGTIGTAGDYNNGVIWQADSIGDNLTVVHHFDYNSTGSNPGELYYAGNDKLYGLTASGGSLFEGGIFYEYDLKIDSFRVLKQFGQGNSDLPSHFRPTGDGRQGIIEVSPGILYLMLNDGQKVVSYNYNTGEFSSAFSLKTFQGGAGNSTLQNKFFEGLYKASDGYFYGSTYTNSQCPIPNPNLGSILKVNVTNNTYTTPFLSPCGADLGIIGYQYSNRFIEDNGKLYSVAVGGGVTNGQSVSNGVIYSFDLATYKYTKLHDFNGGESGNTPFPMVRADNGKFYGTAYGGVSEPNLSSGGGVLYEFDPSNNGFEIKYNFKYNNGWVYDVGPFPWNMVRGKNGKLYGTTNYGVFEYNPISNEIRACDGRFLFGQVGTPSIIEICRKPNYKFSKISAFFTTIGSDFSHDLNCNNASTVVWNHNGKIVNNQNSTKLQIENVQSGDLGSWFAELTNECGTTVTQVIELTSNPLSNAEDLNEHLIMIYPNPVNESAAIKSELIIHSVKVFNGLGEFIMDNGNNKTINTSKFSKGVYYIKIETLHGTKICKLIKL